MVYGDGDRLTPPVHARRMVAALPQVAEFVLLKRTGHMTPVERPVELADALEGLAESVGIEPLRAAEPVVVAEPAIDVEPEAEAAGAA